MSVSRRGLFGLRDKPKPAAPAPTAFSLSGFYRQRVRDGATNGDAIPVGPRRQGVDDLPIATTKVGVCDRPWWRRQR